MTGLVGYADEGWADLLGCDVGLLTQPGVHIVPGSEPLVRWRGIYVARVVEDAVLVYAPEPILPRVEPVLAGVAPTAAFRTSFVSALAGEDGSAVLGPARHTFVDAEHFRPAARASGTLLTSGDPALEELRSVCGEDDWEESGLADPARTPLYGIKSDGQLLAAGNFGPYRSRPADVGVLVHPSHRARGLARRLVSRMVTRALPEVDVLRYSAALSNRASLAVADALGFVPRGEQMAVRLI